MKKLLTLVLLIALFGVNKNFAQTADQIKQMGINADSLDKAGKFQEAAELYEKAQILGKDSSEQVVKLVSMMCNKAGYSYYQIGQFDKASANFHKYLKLEKKLKNDAGVSTAMNNIGMVYKNWGNYDKALEYYLQALEIDEKKGDKPSMSSEYNNIGGVYASKNNYDKALEFYRKSLMIEKDNNDPAKIAIRLNNIAYIYQEKKDYDKAVEYYLNAMKVDIEMENKKGTATRMNNIASVYQSRKNFDKALSYYNDALKEDSTIGNQKGVADRLNNIGQVYKLMGKFDDAIKYFTKSIELKEKLRLTAPSDIRRDYLASQIETYQNLINCHIKKNDMASAFQVIELSSSKVLAERLAKNENSFSLPALSKVQSNLGADEAVLIYTTIDQPEITLMLITKNKAEALSLNKADFVSEAVKNIGVKSFTMAKIPFEELEKFNVFLTAKAEDRDKKFEEQVFEMVIHNYRELLMKPKPDNGSRREELALMFYNFLFKPIEPKLQGIKTLVLSPGGILGYLPFETLLNPENKFLVEKFDMIYTQSLGVSEMLKSRKYDAARKEMLAFGGGVYNEKTYKEDMGLEKKVLRGAGVNKINPKQLAYIQKKVDKAISENKPLTSEYKSLGYEHWSNLKGSLVEVRAISSILGKIDTVTASGVSEKNLKDMARDNKLANYKVLHFSCHGMTIPELPELSALVLSQIDADNSKSNNDGYLRMGEISELKLKADFVNLSACETGLGKIYSGEGVVGLSQSFLIAGANGISVSLWEVADKSTAQFMVEMYRQVQNDKKSYSQSINEVKRKFINGDFGYYWKNPFYWAPFVYYGK